MESTFSSQLLQGQTAVVTGGGSGINQTIAEALAAHGARVALVGRTLEKLEAVAQGIRARGGEALCCPADVRDVAAMRGVFETVATQWGPIDIVIAGAAGNFPAPAAMLSPNGFKSVVEIDLLGTFHTFRLAFEHLRQPGARLLTISAPQAYTPMAMQSHVCAAKAGVDMLMRTLAVEWGPAGIRINSIVPGPTDDTEGMRRLAGSDEARAAVTRAVPLGRMGTRDELAQLALFLCSPAASYITGAVIPCDGGQSLMGGGLFTQVIMGS